MLLGLIVAAREVRTLSRLRERVSPRRDSPRGGSPHPALRADLSRKRERLMSARPYRFNQRPLA
ncbi:hypothetical protein SAMN05216338_104861 [Bradyrhizobium sp. Rc2d]|nr:hypothetical protein SAMN05216338_104861 [Bradyrhizobium sp. Rc2d]